MVVEPDAAQSLFWMCAFTVLLSTIPATGLAMIERNAPGLNGLGSVAVLSGRGSWLALLGW